MAAKGAEFYPLIFFQGSAEAPKIMRRAKNRRAPVEPALRCETRERRRIARIARRGEHAREIPRVAQAEIETLPGDRMQRLRSIADVNLVAGDARGAHLERERLEGAVLDLRRPADGAARGGAELPQEVGLAGREPAPGVLGAHAPDERIAPG